MTKQRSKGRRIWTCQTKRYCEVWLRASNRSGKTIRAYRTDLKQFARYLGTTIRPRDVTRGTIEAWVAQLQGRGYAASSIRRKLASVRGFFGYLIMSGQLTRSPLENLRLRLGELKRLTRVVPGADLCALVAVARHQASPAACRRLARYARSLRLRNLLVIRLLCATGIRVGELVSIRLCDVRERERSIVIQGKGSRERLAYVPDPPTVALLDRYLRQRCRDGAASDALFPNLSGGEMTTENVRQILRKLGDAAKTSVRVTPHMLRHTAATTLLENGADIRIVQEFLGHDSIRSTERYTHVAPLHLRRVLRRANPLKRVA